MTTETRYMGLTLRNPFVVSSSTLTNSVSKLQRLEAAGAGAVVLKSLFEEQILADADTLNRQDDMYYWFPEAVEYVNQFSKADGVKEYTRLISDAKAKLKIPVIASVNCVSPHEWPAFAQSLAEAGADGLELNIYISPAQADLPGSDIEVRYLDIVNAVRREVQLPISVKLGYYFTNPAQVISRLSGTGIQGLVLFNRYYRPDVDVEKLRVIESSILSAPEEITLSLRWIMLLSGRVESDLAAATGIHNAEGAAKQLLAGASAVQICSTLYRNGIDYLTTMVAELEHWMRRSGFESIEDCKGKLAKDPAVTTAFERVQFMKKTSGQYQEVQ